MSEDEDLSAGYPPIMVTQVELAARLQLTTRWIYDLTKDGIFVQTDRKYDLDACHRAYGEYKTAKANEKRAPSATENLAKRKEDLIARRIAREDRSLIQMDEALETVDIVTGAFNVAISGIPARITRNIDERKRIEAICDGVRNSLNKAFGEQREALRSGKPVGETESEDDA